MFAFDSVLVHLFCIIGFRFFLALNYELLVNCQERLKTTLDQLQKLAYRFVGCEFNIDSPKEVAEVLIFIRLNRCGISHSDPVPYLMQEVSNDDRILTRLVFEPDLL